MRAVSCHGFAGGFDLGIAKAGWTIAGKVEGEAGFGVPLVEANRHLLGRDFEVITSDPGAWPPIVSELVFGNPPCSGFSGMSVYQRGPSGKWGDGRGPDSHLNKGMYDVIDYASRTKPEVVAFESVQAAGLDGPKGGHSLMLKLRQRLEEQTGLRYHLTNVFQDNASVGGHAVRNRYHFVAHRFPVLGLDSVQITDQPTLRKTIGDLADHELSWEGKPDGHVVLDSGQVDDIIRIAGIARERGRPWREAEKIGTVVARIETGYECPRDWACLPTGLPMSPEERAACQRTHEKWGDPFPMPWVRTYHRKVNLYAVRRWRSDGPTWVVAGNFLESSVHPWLDRTMTYREAARIMGFPDSWTLLPARGAPCTCEAETGRPPHKRHDAVIGKSSAGWLGKGIPVQAGEWIGRGIMRSLERDPGPVRGQPSGDRETTIVMKRTWQKQGQTRLADDLARSAQLAIW